MSPHAPIRSGHPNRSGHLIRSGQRLGAVVLAGGGLVLATGGGIALASWTTRSSGTGSGTTTALVAPTGLTTAADLAPGASSTVHVTLTNPNPGPITVVSLTGGAARIVHPGSGPCAASSVAFVAQDDLAVRIPAGGTVSIDGAVSMAASAGNGCQRATFAVPVTARAESS